MEHVRFLDNGTANLENAGILYTLGINCDMSYYHNSRGRKGRTLTNFNGQKRPTLHTILYQSVEHLIHKVQKLTVLPAHARKHRPQVQVLPCRQ